METKTGLGHQYKKDERAFLACRQSLIIAANDILDVDSAEAALLRFEIQKLSNKCFDLAYSASEAQKQEN